MFLHSCIINKCTDKLTTSLEELRYTKDSHVLPENAIYTFSGRYWITSSTGIARSHHIFKCYDNEELFLAIAAIRDDSDIHQWLVCTKTHSSTYNKYVEGESWMYNSLYHKLPDEIRKYWRKATVGELIEHFKK